MVTPCFYDGKWLYVYREANKMWKQANIKDTVCKVGFQIPPNFLNSNVLVRVYSYTYIYVHIQVFL